MATEYSASDTGSQMQPWLAKNYSHAFRVDGNKMIAFETGSFGLKVNRDDLTSVYFNRFDPDDETSYLDAIYESHRERMETGLVQEDFTIEIQMKDKTYRASKADEKPRLWEAGKIAQRYDFKGVSFEGISDVNATLVVLVWPDSITFAMDIKLDEGKKGDDKPAVTPLIDGFTMRMQFKEWSIEKTFVPKDRPNEKQFSTILSCNLTDNLEKLMDPDVGVKIEVRTTPTQPLKSDFSQKFNCFLLRKDGNLVRSFPEGYTDIRDYDDFEVEIQNKGPSDMYVPVLLFVQPLANPTGVCPIVCDENHVPTGIPVQLSKNWHMSWMPSYGRFYAYLPVQANALKTYHIRIVYGFYGTLPSASHANLSLVGK